VIDESAGAKLKKMGVRTAMMSALEVGKWAFNMPKGPIRVATHLGFVLRYGAEFGMTRRKVTVVNVKQMADDWTEAIAALCMAHDKDGFDEADSRADKLLTPLLSAPVKQVREFYHAVRDKLRSDKRVPFLVWVAFEAWGESRIKDAPDEGVIRLKNKLASDIAELVEQPIREQIPGAIKRALRWRDPETLEKVKETLEAGAKPKLRGRESCLFLEAGRGKNKIRVML
jgi:hypothetical protein